MSYYIFGTLAWRKGFCRTCGVHIMNEMNDMTPEQVASLPPGARAFRESARDMFPTNIRILNDFDFEQIKDKVYLNDGYDMIKPMYVNP